MTHDGCDEGNRKCFKDVGVAIAGERLKPYRRIRRDSRDPSRVVYAGQDADDWIGITWPKYDRGDYHEGDTVVFATRTHMTVYICEMEGEKANPCDAIYPAADGAVSVSPPDRTFPE